MKLNKNDIKILELIHQKKAITRIELATNLKISQAAVSKRIKLLIMAGYVLENRSKNIKTKGRNAIGLEINNNIGKIIGMYLGPTEISIAVSNINGTILKFKQIKITNYKTIKYTYLMLLDSYIHKENIIAIGIGMNGIVDSNNGISRYSASYNWNNIPIKNELETRYNIPVFLENGVNTMLLYEKYLGNSLTNKNFVILNIDTGVKAGVFLDNKIFSGNNFTIGEIGHITYDLSNDALICNCGNKGCIETIISNWYIEEKVFKLTGFHYNYEEIIENANNGEKIFKNVILEIIPVLFTTIRWITTMTNCEKIIIYGKISKLKDFFWRELNRQLKQNTLPTTTIPIIEKFNYNNKIIVQGSIILALNNLFKNI